MNRERRGFTLIELLVVIGIITVLLAILVPVVSRARIASQTAATTAEMHRISAAIGNYFNDFQAYPGALSNADFAAPATLSAKLSGLGNGADYTQSEDMVMALRGGLALNGGQLKFVPVEVGLGPISFNTVVVSPRKNAYVESNPADFTVTLPPDPSDPKRIPVYKRLADLTNELPELSYAVDTPAPEYLDTYSSQRPILYLRANASAPNTNVVYNSRLGGFKSNFQYDVGPIEGYLRNPSKFPNGPCDFPIVGAATTTYAFKGTHVDPTAKVVIDLFAGVGNNTARSAGSYLLIDAGADRIFGTDDDIVVGAGGGQ
jgi:prepilin-type N-terminal cleavage/methylation domain-containing protein